MLTYFFISSAKLQVGYVNSSVTERETSALICPHCVLAAIILSSPKSKNPSIRVRKKCHKANKEVCELMLCFCWKFSPFLWRGPGEKEKKQLMVSNGVQTVQTTTDSSIRVCAKKNSVVGMWDNILWSSRVNLPTYKYVLERISQRSCRIFIRYLW